MSVEVSMDIAKKNLEDILAKLSPGETATRIGPEGKPMAVLVPLKSSKEKVEELDWDAKWEDRFCLEEREKRAGGPLRDEKMNSRIISHIASD